jgi:hypothetical protein
VEAHRVVRRRGSHIFSRQSKRWRWGAPSGRPLPPRKISGTYFCYRLSRSQGYSAAGRIRSVYKCSDFIRNWNCDLPCLNQLRYCVPPWCSTVKIQFNFPSRCSRDFCMSYLLWQWCCALWRQQTVPRIKIIFIYKRVSQGWILENCQGIDLWYSGSQHNTNKPIELFTLGLFNNCYIFRSTFGTIFRPTKLIKHYAMKAYGEWMYRATVSWPRH